MSNGAISGTYTLALIGTSGNTVEQQQIFVRLYPTTLAAPSLIVLPTMQLLLPCDIRLSWDLMEEADEYQIQLSQTERFLVLTKPL